MPWNDQSNGGGQKGPGQGGGPQSGGPWGGGPRRPWGEGSRPQSNRAPDLEDMLRQFRDRFGGGGRRNGGGGGGARGISAPMILGILFVGWLLTGVYTVNEGERAVITQFGRYSRTTGPGIGMHLPPPFEARDVFNVTGQRTGEIGFQTRDGPNRESVIVDLPDESLMITGDRNIVEIHFRVYYNINDIVAFAFNVRDPDGAVNAVAESAMREVIGRRQLQAIITTERAAVEQDVEQLTQQVLNEYQIGVHVLQVELLRAAAPATVSAAFNDVVNAGSEAETATNNASRDASRIVNEAQAYRERVVREATGEAQRFTAVYDEYRQAPQVTRDRLYIETMERVFREGDTMILDQRSGAVPYLPIENMRRTRPAQSQAQPQAQSQGGR